MRDFRAYAPTTSAYARYASSTSSHGERLHETPSAALRQTAPPHASDSSRSALRYRCHELRMLEEQMQRPLPMRASRPSVLQRTTPVHADIYSHRGEGCDGLSCSPHPRLGHAPGLLAQAAEEWRAPHDEWEAVEDDLLRGLAALSAREALTPQTDARTSDATYSSSTTMAATRMLLSRILSAHLPPLSPAKRNPPSHTNCVPAVDARWNSTLQSSLQTDGKGSAERNKQGPTAPNPNAHVFDHAAPHSRLK
ncbi:hypothetical protein AB1Y20_014543 [Prymnesium parvum]|uniref:Uncharacterized protein n=1 Tax=Prymnesium parvum TaxID=97485 RepID=A0AB34ICM0_PRYPA